MGQALTTRQALPMVCRTLGNQYIAEIWLFRSLLKDQHNKMKEITVIKYQGH